jgi:hypothetical protein
MPDLPELTDYAIQMPGGHLGYVVVVRDGKREPGEFQDMASAVNAATSEPEAA